MNGLKAKIYFNKLHFLMEQGKSHDLVLPFDKEIYGALENIVYEGTPASIHLKYYKATPKNDYQRGLITSMALNGCDVVYGDVLDHELTLGKQDAEHTWVERNGWCYDAEKLTKFDHNLYYKMFCPKHIERIPRKHLEGDEKYSRCLKGYVDRRMLVCTVPLMEAAAKTEHDPEFIMEVEKFKKRVNYNYKEIVREILA